MKTNIYCKKRLSHSYKSLFVWDILADNEQMILVELTLSQNIIMLNYIKSRLNDNISSHVSQKSSHETMPNLVSSHTHPYIIGVLRQRVRLGGAI